MIDNKTEKGKNTIRFAPIFTIATLSIVIDEAQHMLQEAIVGNLFNDTAFSALNLTEPYNLFIHFISYLICVGGAALIVRAQGAGNKEEEQKLYNHCITACILAAEVSGV
ncbi:MAG: hypothetical protein IJ242_17535 [Clostridia bacterium]|nr:hypothetical protein [Clostridia bacterium]